MVNTMKQYNHQINEYGHCAMAVNQEHQNWFLLLLHGYPKQMACSAKNCKLKYVDSNQAR